MPLSGGDQGGLAKSGLTGDKHHLASSTDCYLSERLSYRLDLGHATEDSYIGQATGERDAPASLEPIMILVQFAPAFAERALRTLTPRNRQICPRTIINVSGSRADSTNP